MTESRIQESDGGTPDGLRGERHRYRKSPRVNLESSGLDFSPSVSSVAQRQLKQGVSRLRTETRAKPSHRSPRFLRPELLPHALRLDPPVGLRHKPPICSPTRGFGAHEWPRADEAPNRWRPSSEDQGSPPSSREISAWRPYTNPTTDRQPPGSRYPREGTIDKVIFCRTRECRPGVPTEFYLEMISWTCVELRDAASMLMSWWISDLIGSTSEVK